MTAFYNEIDPYAAAWLRNLIAAGHIAPGVVDERDIRDILPSELAGYTQCHFFAGIGVWSYALRLAGWPDDRPVWTGSCPCQPFSTAGKGAGFDDERHLWPAWHHLIKERRPAVLFGEQVASKDADIWIDLVQDDMEALDYAFGAVPFPAAGVRAPHIRDRLYWMADAERTGLRGRGHRAHGSAAGRVQVADGKWKRVRSDAGAGGGVARALANAHEDGCEPVSGRELHDDEHHPESRGLVGDAERDGLRVGGRPATDIPDESGYWAICDWIECRDGKTRPVEPGTSPLATGAPARVGRLRAYGNAINAEAARVFIECAMTSPDPSPNKHKEPA